MKIFNKINYYIYNIYIIYIVKFYFPYLPHVSENCHLSSVIVLTFLPDAFNRVQFDTFRTEAGLNRFVMTPSKWIDPSQLSDNYTAQDGDILTGTMPTGKAAFPATAPPPSSFSVCGRA